MNTGKMSAIVKRPSLPITASTNTSKMFCEISYNRCCLLCKRDGNNHNHLIEVCGSETQKWTHFRKSPNQCDQKILKNRPIFGNVAKTVAKA